MTRLVRVIQKSTGYRGQAAVRRAFEKSDKMKCQQPLVYSHLSSRIERMKKMLSILFGLFFTFVGFAADKGFDTIVVFGDSLSDNGNLYRYLFHRLPLSPPYFKGRFSNGPVWIEQLRDSYHLNAKLKKFSDYAVGGAGAVVFSKQPFPFSLAMELNKYLLGNVTKKKKSTLFVIWIGANNYLFGATKPEPTTDKVVNAITKGVERLITKGGNKFFIFNLP